MCEFFCPINRFLLKIFHIIIMYINFVSIHYSICRKMPLPRTHDQNRAALCMICLNKAKNLTTITTRIHQLIQQYCMTGYDTSDDRLPTSICGTCRLALLQCEKSNHALPPTMFDHSLIALQPRTRSGSCSCKVCEIASANINIGAVVTGVKKNPRGRPSVAGMTSESSSRKAIKICIHCLANIGPGIPHPCFKSSRAENVQVLARLSSPRCMEKVALSVVKTKANDKGELQLAAERGPAMNLLLSPPPPTPSTTVSASNMAQLQNDLNLSGNKTLKLASNLRYAHGRRFAVEGGLKKKLAEKDHVVDDFFSVQQVQFVKIEKEKIVQEDMRWTVLCKDVSGLIKKVKNDRGICEEDEVLVKIGIDGGGGFLKICLSVFKTEKEENPGVPSKRRKRHSLEEGVTSGGHGQLKDSGVKRLLLLAVVPSVQENFENLKLLWAKLGMHDLECPFTIATDLKLCNILLGVMAHGCNHPCCWCDVHRSHLDEKGTARSTKTIQESFFRFRDSGKKRGMAKDFANVIHLPIVKGQDDEAPVVLFVPPPELHLLIGPVNAMYKGLLAVWPGVSQWLKACNVEREALHGGSFTGNSSRILLQKVDVLAAIGPLQVLPYIAAFKAFSKVVTGCYGSFLDPMVEDYIADFKQKYLDLGISVTPKVHAVFHHILEFCQVHGKGLGPWSEQASESVHYDFQETWTCFKVRSLDHPDYGNRLVKAVCTYNSRHLCD